MDEDKTMVLEWYKFFLFTMEIGHLLFYIDLYNAGRLPQNARKALEIIEGLSLED